MEPCAPGTEDDPPIMYSTLNKQENEHERLLNLKAFLRSGKYENIFELSYLNGAEHWYCKACECPVMGRVFQHEIGKRHSQNLANTNRYFQKERPDDPVEEPVTLEIAPGEPIPPGFEEEVGRISQIQERLDGFKVGPLIALEYLLELQDDDPTKEPVYLCILCDKRGDPRTVVTHLASYNHISQYLQKHFPTSWRALAPYMTKQYKRNWQVTLQKIAEGIEKKFGRLKPYPIDKDKFEKERMHYLQIVGKGRHFSEQSGYTFEELIVHDELTKTHEDEKAYESSAANNWGATFIQKPFKKKDPSPPVVGVPLVRTKGNAQTNPRKQEGAYVSPGQGQTNKPRVAGKPLAENKGQVSGKPQGTQSMAKVDQRRRRSLSSVSSISSDDLSDKGGKNKAVRKFPRKKDNLTLYPQRNERQLPYSRRRSPSPPRRRQPSPRRRSPSPRRKSPPLRRRSPSPRRKSPSPKRVQRNVPVQKQVSKETEQELERIRKIEEYRKLARAIENDLQKTLKQHEKNPEKHPQYNEEWKKFWNRRYKELKAGGVDVAKHDFKPEWIEFWNKRMVELHSDEVRSRKDALRRRLALPEEINPIKFKIGGVSTLPEKSSPKRLPMAAQPDQDNEVILIDDKDDDVASLKRSRSPWEEDPSPKNRSYERIRRSQSPKSKRSRDKSPVKSSSRRSRSRDRYSDKRSRSQEKSRSRNRSLSRRPRDLSRPKELMREKDMPKSKDLDRERDMFRPKEYERGRDSRDMKPRSPKRSHSRERSWERREMDRKRKEYRESSFERDLRGRERIRTVADLPWEVEKAYRNPFEEYYKPPPIMRDATRKPVLTPEPMKFPPAEEDDDTEVNVVDVLRILTALEERLGSLGPKVIDLLAQALALEKKEANSSEALLDNDINCVLFETVKEKLKGQLLAGLVDLIQERAFKKAIKKTASLIHLAGQRKSQRDKFLPKVTPIAVPGVGAVDKAAIAKQIANALILQGKTDVTQAELEQLINVVVGMAEASKNSNKPMTTANFLQQLSGGKLFSLNSPTSAEKEREEKIIVPRSVKKDELVDLEKLTEPLTPSPGKNSVSNMENLSDSDLQTLLQNFKDLSTDEQENLINYLKKLEFQEPERVERLRKFVNLDATGRAEDDTEKSKKKDQRDRESPFSNRLGSLNPTHDDLTKIESDEEDMEYGDGNTEAKVTQETEKKEEKVREESEEEDYTFEDVVKTVSKNVKDKEMAHSKMIVEESMKFDSSKPKPELSSAKDLISNLMSNISKTNSNSGNLDLLGLGIGQPKTNPSANIPITMAGSIDLATLSSINMANLTSIVNNVKSMASTEAGNQKVINFEPPQTARNTGKLNFDPAYLDKPPGTMPSRDFASSRVEFPGLGARIDSGRNVSAPNRSFEETRVSSSPGRHLEGPPREFIRGQGGADRGFEEGPRGPAGGFERGPDLPGRGFEQDHGVPDRGFERGLGGPDRSYERDFMGPDRQFDRGHAQDFERGPVGPDRGFGSERDFDTERGAVGPNRGGPVGPDRGFRGSFDRPSGGPDRRMIPDRGMDRGPVGVDRGPGLEERNFGGQDRGFVASDRGLGPDRGFGAPDRPLGVDRGFDRESSGPNRGFSGPDRSFGGPDRNFGGPDRNFGGIDKFGGADRGFEGGPGGPVGGNQVGPRGGPAFGPRGNVPFGNNPPAQRLPRPGGMDQRNNPRFGGPEYGRSNFNRW